MLRITSIILLFLLTTVGLPQDTVNRTDPTGKKQGFWRKLDKNGKKNYEGQFRNDKPYGEFHYFYPNGKLKAVSLISQDGARSKTVTYYQNGKKMSEGIFINEKKDSLWKFYSDYDGVLLSEEYYKNGLKDGISKTFYASGGIAETMTWKEGIRNGPWEQRYTDGVLKLKGTYRNDMKNGPIQAFHISGKIWMTGQYNDGNAISVWTYYTEDGKIKRKDTYQNGLIIKVDTTFSIK